MPLPAGAQRGGNPKEAKYGAAWERRERKKRSLAAAGLDVEAEMEREAAERRTVFLLLYRSN
eukprot:12404121-Karenia_brevis.AAC.1